MRRWICVVGAVVVAVCLVSCEDDGETELVTISSDGNPSWSVRLHGSSQSGGTSSSQAASVAVGAQKDSPEAD